MASEQDIRLAQGALFVIDNTGPCPTDKKYRAFIDAAIAHHLTRHTYYYQDRGRPGAKNTKRATARKFRNTLQALWEHVKPESRVRKGGDRAESLFMLKSEGIMAKALEMYRYDPATFLENDLPGFVDDGGDILQSQEQTQAASTPAPEQQHVQAPGLRPKRKSESPDEPQQPAAKRPRTEEPIADTDQNSRPSHMSQLSQQLPSAKRSPPRSPQVPLPGPSTGSKRGLESSDEQQQNVAKRPRVDAAVTPTRRKMVKIKLPRCKRCQRANTEGCDGQRPCGKCKAAGLGVEECSGSEPKGKRQMGPDPDAPTTSNAIGPKTNLESQRKKTTFGLEVSRGDLDERSGKVGDTAGSADAQGSPGGKRKRATNDTGIQAGSNATQTTRAPDQPASPKRQATGPSVEDRTNDELPEPVAPAPGGMASGVLNVSNNGKTATVANETVVSDSPEDTQNRKLDIAYEEPQGHKIDLGMLVRQMKKLQRDVELTALDLLACIGKIHNLPCPLDLNPSEGLAALYVRCWGVEWKEYSANQLKVGRFRTVFNKMSLISAFLHDKIFNKQAYDREVAQDLITQLQASGPTGEAMLKALDWSTREAEIAGTISTIAIEKARTILAQDEATVHSQLQKEAETLMKEHWSTMLPHFRTHILIATTYGLLSGQSEEDLYKLFETAITPIIQNALFHQLQLVANGCKYEYLWPCEGDKFNGPEMKEFGALTTNKLVRQVIFPGLRFDLPPSFDYPTHTVIESFVLTKSSA